MAIGFCNSIGKLQNESNFILHHGEKQIGLRIDIAGKTSVKTDEKKDGEPLSINFTVVHQLIYSY